MVLDPAQMRRADSWPRTTPAIETVLGERKWERVRARSRLSDSGNST